MRPGRARIAAGTGLSLGAALGMGAGAEAHTFTVDTLDGGSTDAECANDCSLRDAFQLARDSNDADTDRILFQSGLSGTITLTAGQLPYVDESLDVVGPGAGVLTVSGNDASRIITMDSVGSPSLSISGLRLIDGMAAGGGTGGVGGAVRSFFGDLLLQDMVISGSSASGGNNNGGGVYALGEATIVNSTISGNSSGRGAGVSLNDPATIVGSTISGNRAEGPNAAGGGIRTFDQLTIRRSTISGNSATSPGNAYGGGISGLNGPMTIEDSTIAKNSAVGAANAFGGGVYAAAITLSNTVVADNSAQTGADLDTNDDLNLAFSLIESTAGLTFVHTTPGSNLLGVDPQLGPLASNGGPTQTRALEPGSPAIDAGSATGTDQRGLARPFDFLGLGNSSATGANGADIGALELRAPRCRGRAATLPQRAGASRGTPGRDVIVGSSGPDLIRARGGRDLVCAGKGRDRVIGGGGPDLLRGEGGRDTLRGQGGRDRLFGGPGRDRLIGGALGDRLIGGPGRDRQRQ